MDNNNENKETEKLGFLNIVILVLSVYVLLALMIDTFFKLPTEISTLISLIDDFICIIFLYDFVHHLYLAENKWQFMKWGWIDLVSSIPALHMMRAGRAFRLIRILRILRAFRSTKHLVRHIFRRKSQGVLTSAVLVTIFVMIFSSISILQAEQVPGANIKTAEEAIWWTYASITSSSFENKFPITTEGRIIAALLRTTGLVLFGTLTAFLASWFVDQAKHERERTGKQ